MKRDATDDVFSEAVREADDWCCQRCGKPFPERKGRDVQCMHNISRKFNSLRWHPDNAATGCGSCHAEMTQDPSEHYAFFFKRLGPVRYEMLKQRKQLIVHYRASDKKAIREHYRSEIARIKELRRNGIIGTVELVSYD